MDRRAASPHYTWICSCDLCAQRRDLGQLQNDDVDMGNSVNLDDYPESFASNSSFPPPSLSMSTGVTSDCSWPSEAHQSFNEQISGRLADHESVTTWPDSAGIQTRIYGTEDNYICPQLSSLDPTSSDTWHVSEYRHWKDSSQIAGGEALIQKTNEHTLCSPFQVLPEQHVTNDFGSVFNDLQITTPDLEQDVSWLINWATRYPNKYPNMEKLKGLKSLSGLSEADIVAWLRERFNNQTNSKIDPMVTDTEQTPRSQRAPRYQPKCLKSRRRFRHVLETPKTTKIFECTRRCGESFKKKGDWKRHELYNIEEWKCHICNFAPSRKDKLPKHLQECNDYYGPLKKSHCRQLLHPSARPCGFCGMQFHDWSTWLNHVAAHFEGHIPGGPWTMARWSRDIAQDFGWGENDDDDDDDDGDGDNDDDRDNRDNNEDEGGHGSSDNRAKGPDDQSTKGKGASSGGGSKGSSRASMSSKSQSTGSHTSKSNTAGIETLVTEISNLVSNATQTADLGGKPSLKLFASNADHSGDHRQTLPSDGPIFHVSLFPPTENEVALSIHHLSRLSLTRSLPPLTSPIFEKEDLATNPFMDFDEAFADTRGKQLNDHRRGFGHTVGIGHSCRTSEAPVHNILPRKNSNTTHSVPSPPMAKGWRKTDQARHVRRYYLDGGDDILRPTRSSRSPEMETPGPTDFRGTHSERKEPNPNYKERNDIMPIFKRGRVSGTLSYENAGENKSTKRPNSHRSEMHHQIRGQSNRNIYRYVRQMVVVRETRGYCRCIPINTYYNNNNKGVLRPGINDHDPDVREHSVLDAEVTMDEIYEASHPRHHPYSLSYTSSPRVKASLESERTSTSAQADEQDRERHERLRGIERSYLPRRRNSVELSLWVSLMLADLKEIPRYEVEKKLKTLPKGLDDTYAGNLVQIPKGRREDARFLLLCVVAARRPLKIKEIATAFGTWTNDLIPPCGDLDKRADICSACKSIIYLDKADDGKNPTVNFLHQSVKDFLLRDPPRGDIQRYRTSPDGANLLMLQVYWKYFSMEEFEYGNLIIRRKTHTKMDQLHNADSWDLQPHFQEHFFLEYASKEWKGHAASSYPALLDRFEIDLQKAPTLRDTWLLRTAREGQEEVLKRLLRRGDDPASRDRIGRTPLSWAAERGHGAVVKLLLKKGADVESRDTGYGGTSLRQASAKLAPRAASRTRVTASPSRLSQADATDDDLPLLISTNDLTPTAGGSQTQPLPCNIPPSDSWHVIENALESARASDGRQTPAGLMSLARLESVLATEQRLSVSAISWNMSPPLAVTSAQTSGQTSTLPTTIRPIDPDLRRDMDERQAHAIVYQSEQVFGTMVQQNIGLRQRQPADGIQRTAEVVGQRGLCLPCRCDKRNCAPRALRMDNARCSYHRKCFQDGRNWELSHQTLGWALKLTILNHILCHPFIVNHAGLEGRAQLVGTYDLFGQHKYGAANGSINAPVGVGFRKRHQSPLSSHTGRDANQKLRTANCGSSKLADMQRLLESKVSSHDDHEFTTCSLQSACASAGRGDLHAANSDGGALRKGIFNAIYATQGNHRRHTLRLEEYGDDKSHCGEDALVVCDVGGGTVEVVSYTTSCKWPRSRSNIEAEENTSKYRSATLQPRTASFATIQKLYGVEDRAHLARFKMERFLNESDDWETFSESSMESDALEDNLWVFSDPNMEVSTPDNRLPSDEDSYKAAGVTSSLIPGASRTGPKKADVRARRMSQSSVSPEEKPNDWPI